MIISVKQQIHKIHLEGEELEEVAHYKYLRTTIESNEKLDKEINELVGKVGRAFNAIKTSFLWKREISKQTKIEIVRKVAIPTLIQEEIDS